VADVAGLATLAKLDLPIARGAVGKLVASGLLVTLATRDRTWIKRLFLPKVQWDKEAAEILQAVRQFHHNHPLRRGMPGKN